MKLFSFKRVRVRTPALGGKVTAVRDDHAWINPIMEIYRDRHRDSNLTEIEFIPLADPVQTTVLSDSTSFPTK